MKKNAKKAKKRKAQNLQPVLPRREFVKGQLFDSVMMLGMQQVYELMEEERTALCGERYRHDRNRPAVRAGHVRGILPMGGRTVALQRPRVRTKDGSSEIPLESWEEFRKSDPLTERAVAQMILGVSTRRYARSPKSMPSGIETGKTSKSGQLEWPIAPQLPTGMIECSTEITVRSTGAIECSTEVTVRSTGMIECSTAVTECSTRMIECSTAVTQCSTEVTDCSTEVTECSTGVIECSTDPKRPPPQVPPFQSGGYGCFYRPMAAELRMRFVRSAEPGLPPSDSPFFKGG